MIAAAPAKPDLPRCSSGTGSRAMQPSPEATRSGWYFDRSMRYTDTDFIDAPELMPAGSMVNVYSHVLCRISGRDGWAA